jgi:hypothetical protein
MSIQKSNTDQAGKTVTFQAVPDFNRCLLTSVKCFAVFFSLPFQILLEHLQ